MKNGAKLIVLHSPIQKPGGAHHRVWLLFFITLFTFLFAVALVTTRDVISTTRAAATNSASSSDSPLPKPVFDALVHYASANSTAVVSRMTSAEIHAVASVISGCPYPCNILAFGLTHETPLWRSLNYNGVTVFVGENAYLISKLEEKNPGIEAYDVVFTTRVSDLYDLVEHSKEQLRGDCRPVQNLLFSDCKLAINDLPNHIYDVAWDVILIDGPSGYSPKSPGRMSAIFTAGVLARSKRAGKSQGKTHVFVHEFTREVERVSGAEYLCPENLVESKDSLAHYVVENVDGSTTFEFCRNSSQSSSPLKSSTSPPSSSNKNGDWSF